MLKHFTESRLRNQAKSVVTTGYQGDEEDDALMADVRKIMDSIEGEMTTMRKSHKK